MVRNGSEMMAWDCLFLAGVLGWYKMCRISTLWRLSTGIYDPVRHAQLTTLFLCLNSLFLSHVLDVWNTLEPRLLFTA